MAQNHEPNTPRSARFFGKATRLSGYDHALIESWDEEINDPMGLIVRKDCTKRGMLKFPNHYSRVNLMDVSSAEAEDDENVTHKLETFQLRTIRCLSNFIYGGSPPNPSSYFTPAEEFEDHELSL